MWKPRIDRRDRLIFALLIALTLSGYWQVHDFELIQFDDPMYITGNTAVMAGLRPVTIRWALTTPYAGNWHPLTWISLMADTDAGKLFTFVADLELGKANSGIYHLTNVVLHLANVLLLFVLLFRVTGSRWRSAIVAALFAIHPLHVESVAWVTERKDVLSTFFWLLCTYMYVRWVRLPEARTYLIMLGLFGLGLMAKPMLVTLPVVLLVMDYWPLRRLQVTGKREQGTGNREQGKDSSLAVPQSSIINLRSAIPEKREQGRGNREQWKDSSLTVPQSSIINLRSAVLEKLPMLAMAAVSSGLTLWAQGVGGAVATVKDYPLAVRFANAGVACVGYLWKMVWPKDLAFFYPHPGRMLPTWQVVGSFALLAAVTALAIGHRRKRPYLLFGWLWYVVTLAPVIGLIQVGAQAMADRYTYVPLIGVFVAIVWGAYDLLDFRPEAAGRRARLAAAIAAVVITALAVTNFVQIGYWRNGTRLFGHALAVTDKNPTAHFNLGVALERDGRVDQAISQYRKALKLVPDYVDAHYNLATILGTEGRTTEAIKHLKRALEICPRFSDAHYNLGTAYAEQGKLDLAIKHFRAALKINPSNMSARENLDQALAMKEGGM